MLFPSWFLLNWSHSHSIFCPLTGITRFNPWVVFDLCFILAGNWNLPIKFWQEGTQLIVFFSLHLRRLHVFPHWQVSGPLRTSAPDFISNELQVMPVREWITRGSFLGRSFRHGTITNSLQTLLMTNLPFDQTTLLFCMFERFRWKKTKQMQQQHSFNNWNTFLSYWYANMPIWLSLKNIVSDLCTAAN